MDGQVRMTRRLCTEASETSIETEGGGQVWAREIRHACQKRSPEWKLAGNESPRGEGASRIATLSVVNFDLRVDEALVSSGLNLRRGTCLGGRRQWGRLDAFGRPAARCGCQGNLWAVQGTQPIGCTLAECAAAMGIDRDHMDFEGLTQAVPPVYGDYVFGQAAMRSVPRRPRPPPLLPTPPAWATRLLPPARSRCWLS